MTDLAIDQRVIEPDAPQYNARLIRRVDENDFAGLLLGEVRRRTDSVRGRPVHDDRRDGRRPDRPATLFGGLPAGGRRERGLRAVCPSRPGRHVHSPPVADGGRPGDADDRPEGQVHAVAGGRADTHLHLVGDRQRAIRGDDAPARDRRPPPAGRVPQRGVLRGRAGLPGAARGLADVRLVPGHVRPDRLASDRPAQSALDGPDRPASR